MKINKDCKKLEIQLAEKVEELCEMTKMILERQEQIKSMQISLEEVKEKFRLEYQEVVSEKDKMSFALKEQEENLRNLFEI